MSENMEMILEFVYRGFADSEHKVKEAACLCIGQFAGGFLPSLSLERGSFFSSLSVDQSS